MASSGVEVRQAPATDVTRTGLATGAALVLPAALSGLAQTGLAPVLPRIEQAFAGEPFAATLTRFLATAIGLSMVFGAPLAGRLGSHVGRRPVLIAATLLFGIAGSAGLLLGSLPALAVSRIALGLAMATIGTMITTIITLHFQDPMRHRWLGYYSLTGTIAVMIIIPLSGWLGAINWRAPFAMHLIAFPLAVLFFLALPRDAETARRHVAGVGSVNGSRVPLGLILFATSCGCLTGGGPLFLPFRAAETGVHDPRTIALLLLPQVAGAAVTAFCFGRIRQHLSQRATFLFAFATIASAFLVVGTVPLFGVLMLGTAISGFGTGVITPNLFAMAANFGRDADRARTVGVIYGAFFAGPFAAQLILEPLVQRVGASAGLIGLAAIAGLLGCAQSFGKPALRSD
ncbi:MFS transporter [Flavisphingomonas formosensis]|uniref:MFS transporter n=1 Tax=Flavisphingomonas formosensis TaxID=861534 RepID=UPI0012FBE937|nr:MFS transporter [Sphingomonas formosensis]